MVIDQTNTVKEKSTNGHLTPTEARVIIEAEAQKRTEQCQAEIERTLDKYQCTILPITIIQGGQVSHQVQIISK